MTLPTGEKSMNASPTPIRDLGALDALKAGRTSRGESSPSSSFTDELREASLGRRPEPRETGRAADDRPQPQPKAPPESPSASPAQSRSAADSAGGQPAGDDDSKPSTPVEARDDSDSSSEADTAAEQAAALAAAQPAADVVQLSAEAVAPEAAATNAAIQDATGTQTPAEPTPPGAETPGEGAGESGGEPPADEPGARGQAQAKASGETTNAEEAPSVVANSQNGTQPSGDPEAAAAGSAAAAPEADSKPSKSSPRGERHQAPADDSRSDDAVVTAPAKDTAQTPAALDAPLPPTAGVEEAAADEAAPPAPAQADAKPTSPATPVTQDTGIGTRGAAQASREGGPSVDNGPRVNPERFIARVSRAFQAAEQNGGTVQLRLSPPELGALQIRIAVHEGALTASLEAETPAARNLLLDNLPALRERLAQQDIRVERFDVDVRREPSGGQQDQQSNDGRRLPPPTRGGLSGPHEAQAASGVSPALPSFHAGGLNVVA
ncbi:flagellar hook-length control protein FliK [Pirellulimonas nuda]|uniref:flagellar hook-length control protein FliK n=1 Tax=Pirellulimonas nuda TaxID=2528009 RepID=UPI0011A7CC16|nr:flagellar hook-length control protein FliK [Pirellulimonas nuda]